jgi:hypothetical protein
MLSERKTVLSIPWIQTPLDGETTVRLGRINCLFQQKLANHRMYVRGQVFDSNQLME